MKRLASLLLFLTPLLGAAQTVIQNTTYGTGQNATVNGPGTVVANTSVTVSSGAVVTFKGSTSITLGPGFTASSGSRFTARLVVDTDGDGIPDQWEISRGLNPSNASDAQNATSGGLTYLLEYQLSTTPGVTKQTDSGNSTALNVHRPSNP